MAEPESDTPEFLGDHRRGRVRLRVALVACLRDLLGRDTTDE